MLETSGPEPGDIADEVDLADEASWYRQVQDQPEDGHADSACSWALPGDEGSVGESLEHEPKKSVTQTSLPMLPAVRFQGTGSVDPQINAWQVDALLFECQEEKT